MKLIKKILPLLLFVFSYFIYFLIAVFITIINSELGIGRSQLGNILYLLGPICTTIISIFFGILLNKRNYPNLIWIISWVIALLCLILNFTFFYDKKFLLSYVIIVRIVTVYEIIFPIINMMSITWGYKSIIKQIT